jgi:hypothetical protein
MCIASRGERTFFVKRRLCVHKAVPQLPLMMNAATLKSLNNS